MKVIIVCVLVAVSVSSCLGLCLKDIDCAGNECCAGTPNGPRVCVKYNEIDEQCISYFKNPVSIVSGMAKGIDFLPPRTENKLPESDKFWPLIKIGSTNPLEPPRPKLLGHSWCCM